MSFFEYQVLFLKKIRQRKQREAEDEIKWNHTRHVMYACLAPWSKGVTPEKLIKLSFDDQKQNNKVKSFLNSLNPNA